MMDAFSHCPIEKMIFRQSFRNIPSWAARFMKNQLNCIQVSRHIKDIGQQAIHKEDASKIRDISQNDLGLA
jgi:plasmid maintenance system killer protein